MNGRGHGHQRRERGTKMCEEGTNNENHAVMTLLKLPITRSMTHRKRFPNFVFGNTQFWKELNILNFGRS